MRILFACTAVLFLAGCAAMHRNRTATVLDRPFRSNGEQIFFTATSQRGTSITSDAAMGMMGSGALECASCHGPDGRGGQVQMMMRSFVAPDIRYKVLTAEEMAHEDEEEHPPYTDEAIKRAITQGVNPAGEPLEWPMPRWKMSEADLEDVVGYLESLP